MRVTLAVITAIFVILKGVHGRRYHHFVMGGIDSGFAAGKTVRRRKGKSYPSTTQKWRSVCMPCQKPLENRASGEWWASMEEVFHLD